MRDEPPKKSAREATKSHAGEKPLQLAHGILYNCILLPIVKYWARRVDRKRYVKCVFYIFSQNSNKC